MKKMKMNKTLTAIVKVRRREDLERLATDFSMMPHCETSGWAIARYVLEGNGIATIDLFHIMLAIDTETGFNELLDNYDILDSRTLRPLLYQLIFDKREAHRKLMKK